MRNYKENQRPEVEYVKRTLYRLPAKQWPDIGPPALNETNNNPEVFRRLTEVLADSALEAPVLQDSDALSLDDPSNRANLFLSYQTFWQGYARPGLLVSGFDAGRQFLRG